MKKLILILIPLALVMGQQKKTTAPKPAPAAKVDPQMIPEGAKEVEPYLYTYTAPDGRKWVYRKTPFGVVKWEGKPVTAPPVADTTNPVAITDLGDSVRFSWDTPFGTQKRVRKKSELTDEEKAMMKRDQEKRPLPDPLAGTKPADSAKKTPEKQ